jgi:signal transduction histidine kinase
VRLRAARASPRPIRRARRASRSLAHVGERMRGLGVYEIEADGLALGARAAGGIRVHPVRLGITALRRRRGGLARGADRGAGRPRRRDRRGDRAPLRSRAASRASATRCARPRERRRAAPSAVQSDEVLRLSEALFAQDIELLRSTEKLGKIERLKNDFIEKMSRELRTPLNSIIEAIISVLTGENDSALGGREDALRSALDEGSAFLRTLQNILDLWKIKQGELPVETSGRQLPRARGRGDLQHPGLDRRASRCASRPSWSSRSRGLRTDLTKLNQILFLLLDNAAKFTPEGRILIRGRVAEGKLLVAIEDEGIGICHDDQQFVFDEFFQVDEPSSQKYRAPGLGLTLVRDLITLLAATCRSRATSATARPSRSRSRSATPEALRERARHSSASSLG